MDKNEKVMGAFCFSEGMPVNRHLEDIDII